MNVPQEQLDAMMGNVRRLQSLLSSLFAKTRNTPAGALVDDALPIGMTLYSTLVQAGATKPQAIIPREPVNILLMDTNANRRALRTLEEAYEAALAVDRERYGDSIGTDGEAQLLEMLVAQKRAEIFGSAGLSPLEQ